MKIYLVRHGEAKQGLNDAERRLTANGEQQVLKLAKHLATLNLTVAGIYHSGYVRAQQTAEILGSSIKHQELVQKNNLLPEDNVEIIAQEIEAVRQDLVIVGHMPFMANLLARLTIQHQQFDLIHFVPATIVCLKNINGSWLIDWVLTPDLASN